MCIFRTPMFRYLMAAMQSFNLIISRLSLGITCNQTSLIIYCFLVGRFMDHIRYSIDQVIAFVWVYCLIYQKAGSRFQIIGTIYFTTFFVFVTIVRLGYYFRMFQCTYDNHRQRTTICFQIILVPVLQNVEGVFVTHVNFNLLNYRNRF